MTSALRSAMMMPRGQVEGHGGKLSQNKWLAKIVLGGKMPKYDKMDEPPPKCCCVVS